MTGVAIIQEKLDPDMTYERFLKIRKDPADAAHEAVKGARKNGKTTNFSTEYGQGAAALCVKLMVPEEEAQSYIDAKHETFWRAEEWKKEEIIPGAKKRGYETTLLGARRHLAEDFASESWGIRAGAERRAVNFKIQGSCGEMTKLAMGRIWRAKLLMKYDAIFFGPIHDELVFSCARSDAVAFIQELHPLMVAQYADMKIPVKSSIGIGRNFKDLVEIGNQPTTEKIQGALNELFPVAQNQMEMANAA
jgi:DNA polymerase I-like protein with 3'-5' exonuclease and polymerase domains